MLWPLFRVRAEAQERNADQPHAAPERIEARAFNPGFPTCFPRFVQFAAWRLCSTSELDICNGNRIVDGQGYENVACPVFSDYDRVAF